MARTRRDTVPYFTHDSDASVGRTLTILQQKFGNDGYAAWYKLLEILGRTDGHFVKLQSPQDWEYLAARTGISDAGMIFQILDTLADINAIDSELFKANIVWSQNFVDRLAEVYRKRGHEPPSRPDYLLDDNAIPDAVTPGNDIETDIPATGIQHSIVEETISKGKIEIQADEKAENLWSVSMDILRNKISKPNIRTYFAPLTGWKIDGTTLIVRAPNEFNADYIRKNQISIIEAAVSEAADSKFKVRVEVREKDQISPRPEAEELVASGSHE